jgi:hypothetical protein
MVKKSMVIEARDTIVDAAKASAEGVKAVAGDALGAAAVAAAGVVLQRASDALQAKGKELADARPKAQQEIKETVVEAVKPVKRKSPVRVKAGKKAAKTKRARHRRSR